MGLLKKLIGPKRLTGVVIGALVALAGTALALVIVSMTTSVTSSEYAGEGLALNVSDGGSVNACNSTGDGYSTSGATLPAVTYDLNNATQSTGKFLCVKNDGFATLSSLSLDLTTSNSSDGSCTTAEAAAEGGGGGGGGACTGSGDLEDVLQFDLNFSDGIGMCAGTASVSTTASGELVAGGGSIAPGVECVYSITLSLQSGVTTQQRTAASTDSVDFSLDVTGS